MFSGITKNPDPHGLAYYHKDFESAPGGFGEDDEDDSEDIGKSGFEAKLNYDSDEQKESLEASELISLDKAPKQQKK